METIREYFRNANLLKNACKMHLDQTIAYLRSLHAVIEEADLKRWHALLEGDLWKQTQTTAEDLLKQAKKMNDPVTASFVEKKSHGCMIVVSVAPWCSEKRFIGSLPGYSYLQFIRPYRSAFRDLADWECRDFAHWVFLEGKDEEGTNNISISLFFLWTFIEVINAVGKYQMQHPHEPPQFEKPMILPTSLMSTSPSELMTQLMREDAIAWEKNKRI